MDRTNFFIGQSDSLLFLMSKSKPSGKISNQQYLIQQKLSPYKSKPKRKYEQKTPENLEDYIFPVKELNQKVENLEKNFKFKGDKETIDSLKNHQMSLKDIKEIVSFKINSKSL